MSDAERRQVERAVATGEPGARTRLLVERLRAGELTEEQVALAAYLGHAPARAVLGDGAPARPREPEELLAGLERWGNEAVLRAMAAVLRVMPARRLRLAKLVGERDFTSSRETAARLDDYLVRPCDDTRRAIAEVPASPVPSPAAEDLVSEELKGRAAVEWRYLAPPLAELVHAHMRWWPGVDRAELDRAIVAEVLPWALGTGDPARARVEARGEAR